MRAVTAVAGLVAAVDVLGYLALGAWGVVTASVCSAVVAVVVAHGSMQGRQRLPQDTRVREPDTTDFTSYRRISSMIDWTTRNRHYFDAVTLPFLTSTASALLAERHRVNLETDPSSARRLLGPDVWDMLDATRAWGDSTAPSRQDLTRVVKRLEQL